MRVNGIYIWGAGLCGEKTLQNCKENGINIAGFIDSNETLWNTEKFGLVIYPPKEILQKKNVEILIAVANEFTSMEISEICKKAGVKFSISDVIREKFTLNFVRIDDYICCVIYPFESSFNKYTDLMKSILETINIKPIPIDNYEYASFIWLHWFESIANENDFRQKIDFLKKCREKDKKIIWNVHNKKPHEIQNAENVESMMKLLAQLSYKIVIHSHITIDVIKDICENDKNILSKIIFVPIPHYAGAHGNLLTTNSLQNNKLKILFFGQIRPYKNIELLIKVFNDLNFDDMELSICGICMNKEYEQNLLNSIGCNNGIKLDFRFIADNEIPKLLANNHILALPYSTESSLNSSAIILAFSYARTVISPNIGTIDEISDKSLFFSYDYKSEQEHEQKFKEQIIAIREKYHGKYNELLNLGEKCREYILENNSYSKTAEQLKQVF